MSIASTSLLGRYLHSLIYPYNSGIADIGVLIKRNQDPYLDI